MRPLITILRWLLRAKQHDRRTGVTLLFTWVQYHDSPVRHKRMVLIKTHRFDEPRIVELTRAFGVALPSRN